MFQDLSTRHDWPVKNAIVDLPIKLKGTSKRISSNVFNTLRGLTTRISALHRRRY